MAITLNTPQVLTQTVASVQITGFSLNYENLELKSEYMTLLEDGTPYQRGTAVSTDAEEINGLMLAVQAEILEGKTMDEATAGMAYSFVLAHLEG